MAKEFKVFFSWQADLPSNQTKRFIEDCIDVAKANIPKSIVLVPDEATRNRFGTPDKLIVSTISNIIVGNNFVKVVKILLKQ